MSSLVKNTGPLASATNFLLIECKKEKLSPEVSEGYKFDLRSRGFIIDATIVHDGKIYYTASLGPKLVTKLSLQCNLPQKIFAKYNKLQRMILCNVAIHIINKLKFVNDVWVTTDQRAVDEIKSKKADAQLNAINAHYGSKVSLYFGFLEFYTKHLYTPAIIGALMFLHQYYIGSVDTTLTPIFCIMMSLWATYTLEFWKRRAAELSYMWKVFGIEDEEANKELAKERTRIAAKVDHPDNTMRMVMSFIATSCLVMLLVQIMLFYNNLQLNAAKIFGENSYLQYYPTIIYSFLPIISSALFDPIAQKLNEFEGHQTKPVAENSLIVKSFCLQFVNRYCALLYAAFWLKDIDLLRSLLISLLTASAIINNLMELGVPYGMRMYRRYFSNKKKIDTEITMKRVATTTSAASAFVEASRDHHQSADANISVTSKKPAMLADLVHKNKNAAEVDKVNKVIGKFKVMELDTAQNLANVKAAKVAETAVESDELAKTAIASTKSVKVDKQAEKKRKEMEMEALIESITDSESKEFELWMVDEINRGVVSAHDDYLELVMQYGYVTLFAVVFPLAPALAVLNNFLEYRLDLEKILTSRKPTLEFRSNIGAWLGCLEFISFLSTLTNCFLLAMVSSHLKVIVPFTFHQFVESDSGKFIAMLLIEHVLIGLKVLLMILVDDVPRKIREAKAIETVNNDKRNAKKRIQDFENKHQSIENHTDATDDNFDDKLQNEAEAYSLASASMGASDKHQSSGSHNRSKRSDDEHEEDDSQRIATVRLAEQLNTQFGFDPINMTVLIALPIVLQLLGITPWLYLPLAVLYFGYLQSQKDRIDRKAAVGIITDPVLMKLLIEEMPSWVSDSDFQRVEWMNAVLQKLWPLASNAIEKEVIKTMQPELDKAKPFFLTDLKMKNVSIGTISPKITGIRVHNSTESVVRMDVEIRWAGDPNISLKVGIKPIPITVELTDIRFSASVRIEMLELMAKLPCFKALSVTCMKKPFVDFSLKVASLDIMNLGASEFNVTSLVRNIMHSVLSTMLLYPKKMIIPIVKDVDVDDLAALVPTGILYLTVVKAENLAKANFMGDSDPYVELTSVDQKRKTTIKYHTLNPEWNENFEFLIYDKQSQLVELVVFDSDVAQIDKVLGKLFLSVKNFKEGIQEERTFDLTEAKKGRITLSCTFIKISATRDTAGMKAKKRAEDIENGMDDVIYHVSKNELNNEMLKAAAGNEFNDHETNESDDDENKLRSVVQAGRTGKANIGVLTVSLIRLRNLKPTSTMVSSMLDKKSYRPYIALTVGSATKETEKADRGSKAPLFNDTFSFIIREPRNERLVVKVQERTLMHSVNILGTTTVPIADIMDANNAFEKEYMLDGDQQECYVGFKLQWSGTGR